MSECECESECESERARHTDSAAPLKSVLRQNGAVEHGLLEQGGSLKHVHDHTYKTTTNQPQQPDGNTV